MSDSYIERAYQLEQLREQERRRRSAGARAYASASVDPSVDPSVDSVERYGDPWRGAGPTPGRYTGFGPRGYRRKDSRIQEDVCDLLTQHGELDAGDIEVKVEEGEITLSGTVDSRRAKRLAGRLADAVYGVADVHNELHIRGRDAAPTKGAEEQHG